MAPPMQCHRRRLEGSHADRPRLVGCRSMLASAAAARIAAGRLEWDDLAAGGSAHRRGRRDRLQVLQ